MKILKNLPDLCCYRSLELSGEMVLMRAVTFTEGSEEGSKHIVLCRICKHYRALDKREYLMIIFLISHRNYML